jgi:hypothetical protein
MEERVNCKNCGASILSQTATRIGGICRPCYNQELQDIIAETPFGQAYETSFNQPEFYSENDYDWVWFDIWKNMELGLASLMFSIRCSGHFDWVFQNRDPKFLKLRDAEHLKQWCLAIIDRNRNKANELEANTIKAHQDRATILRKADEMQRTVELAYEILKKRETERAKTDSQNN